MATITGHDVQLQVRHWLQCPVNGYLGSGYGQDLKSILQLPQASGEPEEFIAKMRRDVPMLSVLPPGSTNLYRVTTPPDKIEIVVEVAGRAITVSET